MNSRVERMFGARESWGQGDERGKVPSGPQVRATSPVNGGGKGKPRGATDHREDTPSTALRATSPCGGGKGDVPSGEPEGVKGFVSIRCGGCGKIVNTCLHEKRTIFNCKDCGHPNPLESLKRMKVECPRCSFRGLYQTNREESPIVMECLNCSQPVQLRRGKRRGNYVTIREERI